jgi:hypothetical protein
MGTKQEIRKGIDEAIDALEKTADEVRVKLHLAGMHATDAWEKQLEPRLFEARRHARQATAESKAAIEETLKAFRDFARAL